MAPPGFFSNLPFRPQQGKRKRAGSLPSEANRPTPTNHAIVEEEADEYFTQRPKFEEPKSEEEPHTAKRRRFNDPSDETPVDDSKGVANPDLASTFDDLKLRNRVVRRRKTPVSPFIERKPRGIIKVRRPRPRQEPVFGRASFMDLAEQQLSDALQTKGPQVNVVGNLNGLPKLALEPAVRSQERSREELHDAQVPVRYDANVLRHNVEGVLVNAGGVPVYSEKYGTKYYDEQASVHSDDQEPVDHDRECVCSVAENPRTLVHCDECEKVYHPICVGKERQGSALYMDDRREKAMLYDAKFYRKNRGFTCTECDNKALTSKKAWTLRELNAEKKRRNKLFATRYRLNKGETEPHVCDSCSQQIIGVRHECLYCEDLDFCSECFHDPAKSSLHQHSAGDMKLK
jgi:hypothetical protein